MRIGVEGTVAPCGRNFASAGGILSRLAFCLALAASFAAVLLLASANAFTFPLPNEDDACFFLPSWHLAVHGSLRVPELNAPDGIFWTPHGYFVWLAVFLKIFGATMDVARRTSQLTAAIAVVLLIVAFRRICRSRGAALLCGALLLSPGIIFSANTVRMEPLVLLLYATALLLHTCGCRVAAAAILFLSVVVHPALLAGAALYSVTILFTRGLLPTATHPAPQQAQAAIESGQISPVARKVVTTAAVVLVLAAVGIESLYVLRHLALFQQHMAYQVARKVERDLAHMLFATKRGVFLVAELIFTAAAATALHRPPRLWRVFLHDLLPVFVLALGLSFYATVGREIVYNLYSYAVVPATLACLSFAALSLLQSEAEGVPKKGNPTVVRPV